jgi:micrococcal nuclease
MNYFTIMVAKFIIISILAFSLLDLSCNPSRDRGNPNDYLNVKSVVDGDTFWADDGSEKGIKIRLIGVDAPESRNTGKKKIGYYGQQSKEYLIKLLVGKIVRLEYDVDKTDQYYRTLAYVYLPDGTFVNAELVKKGYAMVMTVPPNVKYAEKFVKLQRRARIKSRGLWNENNAKN